MFWELKDRFDFDFSNPPVLGFSCRPSSPSSRKVWTQLLPLVRLTLRNLTICVREYTSFEMSKGLQAHFYLNRLNWIIFLLRLLLGLGFALMRVERGGF